mgnify:CR=1 FL=1|jgi:hypothetical protein
MSAKLCLLCSKDFPRFIRIDGVKKNLQHRKYCLECSPFGKHNTRQLAGATHRPKSDPGVRVVEWRKRVKQRAVIYKGGCCIVCGYLRCVAALSFHHTDPTKKDFNISGSTRAWCAIKLELDKCVLLCHNCHCEVHHGTLSLDAHMFKNPTPNQGDRLLSQAGISPRTRPRKTCPDCGSKKSAASARCRKCAAKTNPGCQARIAWPPSAELLKMVEVDSFLAIGRRLGVSDNAVRKHLRNHS